MITLCNNGAWLSFMQINPDIEVGYFSIPINNDADYNALISDAKTQTDDAARLDDMLKAEKKLVEEDAVVAPVYHRGSAVLTKSNVKNLISHPIGVPLEFKYASFE